MLRLVPDEETLHELIYEPVLILDETTPLSSLTDTLNTSPRTIVLVASRTQVATGYVPHEHLLDSLSAGLCGDIRLMDFACRDFVALDGTLTLSQSLKELDYENAAVAVVTRDSIPQGVLTSAELRRHQGGLANAKKPAPVGKPETTITTTLQELRSPLAAIEVACDLLKSQFPTSAGLEEIQKRIRRNCRQIKSTIEGHAVSEAGVVSTHQEVCDVPRFMNALASDLQSIARNKGVRLVLDVSTNMTVLADRDRLHRTLATLLEEFIYESQETTIISLITAFEPYVVGASKGHLKLVIAGESLKRKEGRLLELSNGAMSGLSSLVKRYGGNLEAESSDGLLNVTITIPGATLSRVEIKSKTIVVVDDDVDIQEYLCTILENAGFRVISANDGFDALLVIERHRPDVVLTDVMMPNMDGLDLVSRIKRYSADLPVILFSGFYDELPDQSGPYRPDIVLAKPLNQEKVLAAVASVVSRVRAN